METDTHWLISAGLVTSSVIAIAANSFLLLIFCRRRGLRTVPNRFVINLLIANLLSSLLLIPLLVLDQSVKPSTAPAPNHTTLITHFLLEEVFHNATENGVEIIETSETLTYVSAPWSITNALVCHVAQISTSFICTLSILSILLIGANQYCGVIHSLRYHAYINKCRSTIFILSTWVLAALCGALSAATSSDANLWDVCQKGETSKLAKVLSAAYSLTYFILIIITPFIAICVIYVCIYRAAHRNSERMRKSTSANFEVFKTEAPPMPKVHSVPNFMRFEVIPPVGTNFITNLRHKISNVSVFKYREETRAAKISVLVIFLVLFCYVPYGLNLVANAMVVATPPWLNYVTLVLLMLSNGITPFLFGYRNRRIKREIGRVLGVVPNRAEVNRRRSACDTAARPFLDGVPEVVVTCERKSILKRVKVPWTNCKKCDFIAVPGGCAGEARGSFSSASTQISNEDC